MRHKPMKIAFRVDASANVGFGHLMRCLALAERFVHAGFACHFFVKDSAHETQQLVEKRMCVFHAVEGETTAINALTKLSPDWIVFDGYEFDRDYEIRWTPSGSRVLVIDDLANRLHQCDVIVDPTPGRTDEYAVLATGAIALVGVTYALLDQRFAKIRQDVLAERRSRTIAGQLLITLGGASMIEPLGVIAEALKRLPASHDIETIVLSKEDVQPAYRGLQNVKFIKHSNDMPSLFSQADICVGAAGGASWERCCLGLPTIVLQVAGNQKENARILSERGAAIHVQIDADEIASAMAQLLSSRELRSRISENAVSICDGRGVERVFHEIVSRSLTVRRAELEDAKFIYKARYDGVDPRTYRSSLLPGYREHVDWLTREIVNASREFLILELAAEPVAHVRFDADTFGTGVAEVGIALAENARGKGLGAVILATACSHYFVKGGQEIVAEIKRENHASLKVFQAAGFRLLELASEEFFKLGLQSTAVSRH